jgi:hypothetical protein
MEGDRYGQSAPEAERAAENPFEPAPGVGRLSGPVDTLFGDGAVPSRDEAAASALASAFGGDAASTTNGGGQGRGTPAASTPRQPTDEMGRVTGSQTAATRPAGSELSLDHVFRETPRRGSEKRREAPAFSFDQFFSDGAGKRGTTEMPATPTPSEGSSPSGDEGADIEQFNAWLEGLKKK